MIYIDPYTIPINRHEGSLLKAGFCPIAGRWIDSETEYRACVFFSEEGCILKKAALALVDLQKDVNELVKDIKEPEIEVHLPKEE